MTLGANPDFCSEAFYKWLGELCCIETECLDGFITSRSGSVYLDVINQTWSPMFDLINVLEVFLPQLLLYPNPSDPLNGEASALMMRDRASYEQKILFGCVAQYTIMPAFGAIISKALGPSPALAVGLILLGCCPGGTASNVVTLIAQGDVPLSIVMTACTTLAAVFVTPLLTKILAGAYVPVDAVKLSISILQVVVAPIILGSYLQKVFPALVKVVLPFAPLLAVLASSLLASSVFSDNLVRLKQSMVSASNGSDLGFKDMLSGYLGVVVLSVILLYFAGLFVGYAFFTFLAPSKRNGVKMDSMERF